MAALSPIETLEMANADTPFRFCRDASVLEKIWVALAKDSAFLRLFNRDRPPDQGARYFERMHEPMLREDCTSSQ